MIPTVHAHCVNKFIQHRRGLDFDNIMTLPDIRECMRLTRQPLRTSLACGPACACKLAACAVPNSNARVKVRRRGTISVPATEWPALMAGSTPMSQCVLFGAPGRSICSYAGSRCITPLNGIAAVLFLDSQQVRYTRQVSDIFASNAGDLCDLPQLVLVEAQSSSKSSSPESLTGLPFPCRSGLCKRFASQISVRRSPYAAVSALIKHEALCLQRTLPRIDSELFSLIQPQRCRRERPGRSSGQRERTPCRPLRSRWQWFF